MKPFGLRELATFAIATLAALLVLVATQLYGAGLSPDSASYIRAARSLLHGHGMPTGYVSWPPLYPAILALTARLFGAEDPINTAHWYGAVNLAIVVITSAWLLGRQRLNNRTLAFVGAATVAVCEPLFDVSLMAWSEGTFVLLSLLALGNLDRAMVSDSRRSLLAAGLFAGLAFLTRYMGFTLILAGVLALLSFGKSRPFTRMGRAAVFAALGSAPCMLWVLRNWAISGSATGERTPVAADFAGQLMLAVATSLSWIPLQLVLVVALGGAALSLRGLRKLARPTAPLEPSRPMPLLALFSVIYLASLAALAANIQFDTITARLTVPAILPLFLYAFAWIDRLLARAEDQRRGLATLAASVLGLILITGPAISIFSKAREARTNGAGGYNTRYWREHPMIAYLREHPLAGPAESNAPDALELLLEQQASMTPGRASSNADVRNLQASWPAQENTLVVWFNAAQWRGYLYTLQELSSIASMQPVSESTDAILMTVSRKPAMQGGL